MPGHIVRQTNIFTTHTPVPAGNDEFPLWMIDKYFSHLSRNLKCTRDQFIDTVGTSSLEGAVKRSAMSWPALSGSVIMRFLNCIGQVARKMWAGFWRIRIKLTIPNWTCYKRSSYRHLAGEAHGHSFRTLSGTRMDGKYDDPDIWTMIDTIPEGELWAVRRHLKNKLVILCC